MDLRINSDSEPELDLRLDLELESKLSMSAESKNTSRIGVQDKISNHGQVGILNRILLFIFKIKLYLKVESDFSLELRQGLKPSLKSK